MKKLTSVLLTLILLVTSMFSLLVPVSAATDVTSAKALAESLGATDEKLILSEDFDTATDAPVSKFGAYTGTSGIADKQWQTTGAVGTSTGLTGNSNLKNFLYSFQFSATDTTSGSTYVDFAYHSTTGWKNLNNYNRLNMWVNGGKFVFVLSAKESVSKSVTTSYVDGDLINVIMSYVDGTVSAYIWKAGEDVPTAPTLSVTATVETSGDLFYHFNNGTFKLDNFLVYDLTDTTLYPEQIATATGLSLSSGMLVYHSDFDTATDAPVGKFGAYTGTSGIVGKKWQTTGEVGTSTGLTGNSNLKNFVYGFQFSATDTTSGSTFADFAYHSTTGWKNLNNYNRLNMWINGGKFVFVLSAKESVSKSVTTSYVDGDLINVIMSYVDGTVSAYIWKAGEDVPTAPTLSVTATVETGGDLYYHFNNGTFKLDNFFVYNLDDTTLYPEQIATATGIELDSDMLEYRSDFDTASSAPVSVFDTYLGEGFNGVSKIENGKWVTGGTIGTSTGLTKLPYLKNFAYGFQFSVNDATDGYFATFAYHSTTGWSGLNPENRLQMWETGGKLAFGLHANDGVSDDTAYSDTLYTNATTELVQGDLVNVVMSYVDGTVSAYIWKAGEAVPTVPTITLQAQTATNGDFYFTLSNAIFTFEDIYVYDLTSDDSDGVYTTMESSYQMESLLDASLKMPKTIETTVKLPKTMTGGAGNTIIGNYADADWTFSFEINANGNPYLIYNPPWREWKRITFTDIDIRTGEWEHLALVLEDPNGTAPTVTCYLNGDEVVQTIAVPAEVNSTFSPFIDYELRTKLYIGRDMRGAYDKYYFKGKIKNLSMFSDIRTADEIAADMSGVAADADNLIASYDFDGCYGTGVADRSSNSYDLVNVGYMDTDPAAPTDYAYSFAVVGDTQILTRVYPEKLSCIYDWIVNNKEAHNIQYVMGLGDITDSDTDKEWALAASEISKLSGVVPFSLVRGNHDSEQKFSTYLTDIYSPEIDGCYNGDINSSYKIFTVGEVDYLLINLNMGAIDEELLWAEELIKTHPNHNVIITTHIYLDSDGTHIDDYGTVPATTCRTDANNGDDIWNELISKYSNISLVMSGHVSCTEVLVKKSDGANGNTVTQMLIDPQSTDESYSAGPAGLVTMLYFSEDGKTVQVRNYSTVNEQYYGPQNQFTMELDTVDYLYGDANDDGIVDIRDLIRVKRALAETADKYNNRTADCNKDKKLDGNDLTSLKKKLLNVG